MAKVAFEHVEKKYPNGFHAVHDLNLDIEDGEFLVLVGPSGCGKSTALRMIAGLEDVSSGKLLIGDRVVNDLPPQDRDIAMVFQSYALYPHLSVADNIAYGLKISKMPKGEIAERIQRAADMLELGPFLERKPAQLSGGQRQRVAMGRAIVRDPAVFLMDEPLSNLDAKLRVQMRAEISSVVHNLGTTTVYVTHDQIEAMTLADRIVAMHGGVVQQVGTPLDLYDRPANLFVAGFIGSPGMNFLEGRYHTGSGGAEFRLADGTAIPLSPRGGLADGAPATLGIRPEHVSLSDEGRWEAGVDLVEPTGFGIILHLALHGQAFKAFTLDRSVLTPAAGLRVSFPAEHLHLFDEDGNRV